MPKYKWVFILFLVVLFSSVFAGVNVQHVSAQDFAGSNIDNYYCLPREGYTTPDVRISGEGDYVCDYDTDGFPDARAVPRPPTLRQLEYWFVRLVYVLWAVSGVIFTVLLGWIGFLKLTSFQNVVALADVVKKFRKWMIGFALVFLSYPFLVTFFNVLQLRESECFNFDLPGFHFFFPTACQLEVDYATCLARCTASGVSPTNCETQCANL